MEIKALRYFLAVAREENMTRAADILHVSQPTLSKQIKSLEEELNTKLFIRHSFQIELTDEGQLLRKRAADLVDLADKISDEFLNIYNIMGGDIYFGLGESYQIKDLAASIKAFKQFYPHLHFHITSGDSEQVIEKLDRGVLDLAVLMEEPDPKKYDYIPFPHTDIWGLVIPKDDPLSKKEVITIDDLIGLPLFCSDQSWEKDIPRWCGDRMNELHQEGSFRLNYNATIFASEGLGYVLTFKYLTNTLELDLTFRPLYPTLETKLYLAWKKYQVFSPVVKRFIEFTTEYFATNRS